MLRGMTGFAQAKGCYKNVEINLEMRSLNHRFFECAAHLPEGLGVLEDMIKDEARAKINRARLTAILSINNLKPTVTVNYDLAQNYTRALKNLNQKLKLENNITLSQVTAMQGILTVEKVEVTPELARFVKGLVYEALAKLLSIKDKEGRALNNDVSKYIGTIQKESARISTLTKASIKEKAKKLSDDEYGVFLKGTDISEELARINYHVKNFKAILSKNASGAKELDFVSQEIQREANTISAKAQDARVSSSVIQIKSAIDKIREQLQNAE